ncbi:MAG: (Fe-S)-binding protein [Planctomycetia bacterium]|nr:(Fe-S)-binding protein [Planctomycetia bacterium]
MNVSLMITCLADTLRPQAGQATVAILRKLGHEVVFHRDQTCCGQPMFNSGLADLARQQARHTIRVFSHDDLPVVTPSGSCAAMVKVEYPQLLEQDTEWAPRAAELAGRTYELSDFLVNYLGVVDVGAKYQGKVAHHFACHLRALNQSGEVEKLIEHVQGATCVPLTRQDQCCGFGGSFAVRYPQISGAMVQDKAKCILESGADAVVSTDTGCLMNIGGCLHRRGAKVEVLHLAELLVRD